jgi:integrase
MRNATSCSRRTSGGCCVSTRWRRSSRPIPISSFRRALGGRRTDETSTGADSRRPSRQQSSGRCGFHDLRHTQCSLLISEGLNVVYVSRAMGHASPDHTLKTYSHLWVAAEHASKASAALDAVYSASVAESTVPM